jgi:HEAT repeat protein
MLFPSRTITLEGALRDLGSADPGVRAGAAHALGDVDDEAALPRAIAALEAALRDPHPDVRAAAALALGALGDPDRDGEAGDRPAIPVAALITGLDDGVPIARQACAIALGRLRAVEAFEPLARQLGSGAPDARFQAVTSLAEIDPDRAFDLLLPALADADGEVAGAAAQALGAIGDPRAIDGLARLLEHARPATRFETAFALAELGDARAVPALVPFLDDKELAWSAVDGLERAGGAEAATALAALLDARVARPLKLRAAAAALTAGATGAAAERARAVLLAGLRAWRPELRALAVEWLGRAGGPWASAALRELRDRRGGRDLVPEIDAALRRITARATGDS